MALEVRTMVGARSWSREELEQLAHDGRVPVAALVPDRGSATHASFESVDGDYRASIPLDEVHAGGWVCLEDTLRLLIPEGRTLCWNVKDLGRIRLTEGPEEDSVPENPPH